MLSYPTDVEPPAEFDAEFYRLTYKDLRRFSDPQLEQHYLSHGIGEGRRAYRIANQAEFVGLIPTQRPALEIGPFCRPLLAGPQVKYFDVLSTDGLVQRAIRLKRDASKAPHIHFVSASGDLGTIDETFDFVLSCHVIEHQPDLVHHLKGVANLLSDGGRYFVIIPDKRYCFDAHLKESSIADVLDAFQSSRRTHSLKSVIEHRALTTHNDFRRHWDGDHGPVGTDPGRIRAAIAEFNRAKGAYVDVHAWCFVPDSAKAIFALLYEMKLSTLRVERVYQTRRGACEFWVVLRKMA